MFLIVINLQFRRIVLTRTTAYINYARCMIMFYRSMYKYITGHITHLNTHTYYVYARAHLICFLDRWHYAHVICRVRCAQLCIAGDHLCACSYVLHVCISVWCRTQGVPINIYQCVFVYTRIWQGQDVLRSLQTVVFVSHTHIHTRVAELTNVIYITILHVQCTIILYYYYHHYNIMMNVWTFFCFSNLDARPTISDYYRHYHRRKPECREGVTYIIL